MIIARSLFLTVALFAIHLSVMAQVETSPDEVVRVSTNLVTIPVSVLDRHGRFIPDLKQEQFQLFENGIQQEIAYFESADKPFTVALLLDISDSTNIKLQDIKNAAIAFTEQLRPEDRVIVVVFDTHVTTITHVTSDLQVLQTAIRRINPGSGTSLYSAVKLVVSERLNRIRGRKAIVLFTDGVDTTSRDATYDNTLHTAQELDALIYTIQYNTYYDELSKANTNQGLNSVQLITSKGESLQTAYTRGNRYLHLLAEKSGGRIYYAGDLRRLKESFARIAQELRQQYSIGFYPKDSGSAQPREIKVRVASPGSVVRARRSYVFKSAPAQ